MSFHRRHTALRHACFAAPVAAFTISLAPAAKADPLPPTANAPVTTATTATTAPTAPASQPLADATGADATARSARFAGVERPWLYATDPTAPPPGGVIASTSVGYAQIDRGAARPFAANVASAGAVFGVGAEVGVLRFASLHAEGLLAGDGSSVNAGGLAGVTFYPLPATTIVDVAVSGGYLRELGGADGAWGRVTAAGDVGPVRLALSALGEHVFSPGRDPFDLLVSAGASWKVASFFRLGAEYVAQDLEDAWEEEEADGGVRHFVSPTAMLEIQRRVRIAAGPAFGLSPGSPAVLGRFQAVYSF